jgi:choline dehydrogenase
MEVDYIIVGAGAAGCVLAARLTQDPATSVLLLETGGRGRNPLLAVPKAFYLTMQRPQYAYHYPTRPMPPDQRTEIWLRGKVLGGSTVINGMMYTRGWAPDYDALVDGGNPGWGWPQMLAAFRAMEDHGLGAGPWRGTAGPLHVSVPGSQDRVTLAMLGCAAVAGLTPVEDFNAGDDERIGFTPCTIDRGLRVSAASAFLRPARRRPNLTVLDRTTAGHLLFAGDRVVGVRATHRGGPARDYRARREVLLAAGTVESPLLLERSGIGDPVVLVRAGVEPRVDNPQVGGRILEHRGTTLRARLRPGLGYNGRLDSVPKQLLAGAGYLLTRRGPVATGAYDLVGALRSAAQEPRPDVQVIMTPMSTDVRSATLRVADHCGLMIQGYQLRPTTPSSVHVSGPSAGDPPVIDAHVLESDLDRRVTGRILQRLRELLTAGPLADLLVAEESPGPRVATQEQAVEYARATGAGIYHAIGSCAMGPRDVDVVDARLRVRGTRGLRVVDASVFPAMPSGNTAAPTMALAWRAADLLREDA